MVVGTNYFQVYNPIILLYNNISIHFPSKQLFIYNNINIYSKSYETKLVHKGISVDSNCISKLKKYKFVVRDQGNLQKLIND